MKRFLGFMLFGLAAWILLPVSSHAGYMEKGTDRPGSDYDNFDLRADDPSLCLRACEGDRRCRAWTYVHPNTIQGPNPRCWLKDAVPPPQRSHCCVSGVVTRSDRDHMEPDHPRHARPDGEWQTNFGMMTLDRSGTMVEGRYEHNNGRITGTLDGSVLRGFWFQDRADVRCERPKHGTHYWGRLKFVFTGLRFTGNWGYCEDRPTADWNGHRAR
jgi:hypothetical protein